MSPRNKQGTGSNVNPVFSSFLPAMNKLDDMIHKLELNLGKKHSASEFDDLKIKYSGVAAFKTEETQSK